MPGVGRRHECHGGGARLFNGLSPPYWLGPVLGWLLHFYERFKPEKAGALNHASRPSVGACMVFLTNLLVKTRLTAEE